MIKGIMNSCWCCWKMGNGIIDVRNLICYTWCSRMETFSAPRQDPLKSLRRRETNKPHILETCFHNTNTSPKRITLQPWVFFHIFFAASDQITEGKHERKQVERLKQINQQNDHNKVLSQSMGGARRLIIFVWPSTLSLDISPSDFAQFASTSCFEISFFHTLVLRILINDIGD